MSKATQILDYLNKAGGSQTPRQIEVALTADGPALRMALRELQLTGDLIDVGTAARPRLITASLLSVRMGKP